MDPFAAPRESDEQALVTRKLDWPQSYARRAAFGVYAAAIGSGFAFGAHPQGASSLLGVLAVSWAISYFCALDARAHHVVFPHSFWLFTSLAWPVAPLAHLVRVRGASGALTYAVHAPLVAFCAFMSAALGAWLSK